MSVEVGSIVWIKDWDSMADEWGVGFDGSIYIPYCFIHDMRKYCGKLFKVRVKASFFKLEGSNYNFSKEMFQDIKVRRIL